MKYSPLLWSIVLIAIIASLAAWYYPRINQYSDVFFYEKISDGVASMKAGNSPGEEAAWYPAFAGAVFYAMGRISGISFVQAWLGSVVAFLALSTGYIYFFLRRKDAYLLPLAVLVCIFFIGFEVTFARYDILLGILIVLAWQAHRAKQYTESMIWIVLAGGLKAVPFVLLPLLLLATPRKDYRRALVGIILGAVAAVGLPMLLIGPQNYMQNSSAFALYHSARGFQVESTFSGLDMLVRNLLGHTSYLSFHHFATHNMGLGDIALRSSVGLLFAGLAVLYWRIWKMRANISSVLATSFLCILLWTVLVAPIFSPQFLLWFTLLALIFLGESVGMSWRIPKAVQWPALLVLVITLATHWMFPWHYREFVNQVYVFNTFILTARNVAVLLLLIWSLRKAGILFRLPFAGRFYKARDAFLAISASLTSRQSRTIAWGVVALAAIALIYIGSFQMMDRDFWWHIKAGEIMAQTKSIISIEPFAYTREGQPYLASQSWLSQIALYGIYAVGGSYGIIGFRIFVMMAVFGLFLTIDKKRAWAYVPLIVIAGNAVQGAFMERPQLFTFLLFASFLILAFRVLEMGLTKKYALAFIALEILWINMHGAASLAGIYITGLLGLQYWYANRKSLPTMRPWVYLLVGMLGAFFVSPGTYHNITYLVSLFTDKTAVFIAEWQPRAVAAYLGDAWILWVAAFFALWHVRRNWVYCLGLLLATGYLSFSALRHESLFVFSAVAITIYQLKYSNAFHRALAYIASRHIFAVSLLGVLIFGLFGYTKAHYQNFVQEDQLYGYGMFTPAKGAYDFIEQNNIRGNMFNTYGIGGYLLYRGYSDRKVYIDGRNVDYGFDFMNATYEGGLDEGSWKKLEDAYGLTYAIIDYKAIANAGRLGYSVHLDKNPDWQLAYVDDWTAVYAKDIPENTEILAKYSYRILTPVNIDTGEVLSLITLENKEQTVAELMRSIEGNPDGVKARLILARIYLADGQYNDALALLRDAQHVQPHLADVYQLLASVALAQQQWIEAADHYETMLRYTGRAYRDINYDAIADVFEKAGHPIRAAYYRLLAAPELPPSEATLVSQEGMKSDTSGPVSQETIGDLLSSIGEDIEKSNDEAIALAEEGKLDDAKNKFMYALALDPGNSKTLNNLGVLSLQAGNILEGVDYFMRALEREKEYPDANFNLAIAYYQQGQYAKALLYAKKAQELGAPGAAQLIQTIESKK